MVLQLSQVAIEAKKKLVREGSVTLTRGLKLISGSSWLDSSSFDFLAVEGLELFLACCCVVDFWEC